MEEIIEIYCDGGARGNPGPAASAFVINLGGRKRKVLSKYLGVATNNVAEYMAVALAFRWLTENLAAFGSRKIVFYLDSQLIVRQLLGEYKVKREHLKKIYDEIKNFEKQFSSIKYVHVYRNKNKLADELVNERLDRGE